MSYLVWRGGRATLSRASFWRGPLSSPRLWASSCCCSLPLPLSSCPLPLARIPEPSPEPWWAAPEPWWAGGTTDDAAAAAAAGLTTPTMMPLLIETCCLVDEGQLDGWGQKAGGLRNVAFDLANVWPPTRLTGSKKALTLKAASRKKTGSKIKSTQKFLASPRRPAGGLRAPWELLFLLPPM